MIGKTILHYRILAELGRGGMGVVYKAEDTKLKREVALKFLPANALQGQAEKERFLREAQAAAALNHANICHIYAIEEHDGQMFIAMELIEGQSLEDIVGANGRSPLPLNDAIDYASQIAAGLQAAHEKGIIHRDIKSANIMVSDKGVVKIMDFGLAKLANRSKMTVEGLTLGTAAYMSPEQARGEALDKRSDIWSLGVVLYEMISGQLPFKGDYEQAVIYSILNVEPEPLTALRSGLPITVDGIIAKALAKDPAVRYQHVDELPADLRGLDATLLNGSRISTITPAGTAAARPGQRLPWLVAAVSVVTALTALILFFLRPALNPTPTIRSFVPLQEKSMFTGQAGWGRHLALSPDGRRLTFVATDSSGKIRLWIRSLDTFSARWLPGTEGCSDPFWAPDNRHIAFFAEGKLRKIQADGGPALTICDAPNARGGTWDSDSGILFAPVGSGPLYLVSAKGGTPVAVTSLDSTRGQIAHRWPYFLPDGKHFLYFAQTSAADAPGAARGIYVASLDGTMNKHLLHASSNVAYASGHLLFHRRGTLMAQRFDLKRFELIGEAMPIAKDMHYDMTVGDLASFAASENGILAYRWGVQETGSKLIILDRAGNQLSSVGAIDNYTSVRFSPNAEQAAVAIFDRQSHQNDIWLYDLARGTRTRLTFDLASDRFPLWSPNGKRIVFQSNRGGLLNFYQKAASGAGRVKLLFESQRNKQPLDWSSDGKYIAYITYGDPETRADLWSFPLAGDPKPIPILHTESDELYPSFSPDGQWLAYVSNESGQEEVYVRPFSQPGQDGKWQVSIDGGTRPRWRNGGKELFYLSSDNKIMMAKINTQGATIEVGTVRPLFQINPTTVAENFDVSGDGSRFIVNSLVEDLTSSSIALVMNWTAELEKK